MTDLHRQYALKAIDDFGLNAEVDELFPAVYDELRAMAHKWLSPRSANATPAPTAIVHEVYLRLAKGNVQKWENRNHFRAIAARAMRQILVDDARRRRAEKRGGKFVRIPFTEDIPSDVDVDEFDMVDLETALTELASLNTRHAATVELRLFAELSVKDVAKVLDVSERTVKQDWRTARLWLFCKLRSQKTAG